MRGRLARRERGGFWRHAMDIFSHLTWDYVLRFFTWEHLLTFVTVANALGLLGGVFYVASVSMKTVIPLRIAAIVSTMFFLGYGLLAPALPTAFMYAMLLPLNTYRLFQIRELIKKVRIASKGDLSMNWLEPFMKRRGFKRGTVLFNKGDPAAEMFLIVKGKFLVKELNIELLPGHIIGEMGLLTPDNCRTQTVVCIESGHCLTITYDKVRELYFENPEFGFHFLRLTSQRLLQNVARLEAQLAVRQGTAQSA
jgi:Cyclic nucleotide-binding domain